MNDVILPAFGEALGALAPIALAYLWVRIRDARIPTDRRRTW